MYSIILGLNRSCLRVWYEYPWICQGSLWGADSIQIFTLLGNIEFLHLSLSLTQRNSKEKTQNYKILRSNTINLYNY